MYFWASHLGMGWAWDGSVPWLRLCRNSAMKAKVVSVSRMHLHTMKTSIRLSDSQTTASFDQPPYYRLPIILGVMT